MLWPLFTHGITSSLPAGSDAAAESWSFSWLPFAILHGHNPLVTTYVNYPEGANLLASTTVLGLAFLFWPITAIAGPVASFNVACLVAPTLSAGAMYLLARTVTSRRWIAWVSGLIYGFTAYMATTFAAFHLHLSFVALPPLFFLALYELFVAQRIRAALLGCCIAVVVVLQFFISTEILLMMSLVAIVTGLSALPFVWSRIVTTWRYVLGALGTAVATSLAVLAVPLYYVVAGPDHVTGLETSPQLYRADLLGGIYPGTSQAVAPHYFASMAAHFAHGSLENYSYLGLPLVIVVLAGMIVLRRQRIVLVAGVTALVAFVLSLGGGLAITGRPPVGAAVTDATGTWLPERILENNALFENIIPSRFALFTILGAAVVLAAVLDAVVEHSPNRRSTGSVLALVVVALCLIPLLPRLPFPRAAAAINYTTPRSINWLARAYIPAGSAVLTYPYPGTVGQALVWQAQMDMPFKMPSAWFRVPTSKTDSKAAIDPLFVYGFPSSPADALVSLERGTPVPVTNALKRSVISTLDTWKLHWVLARLSGPTARADKAYLTELFGTPLHSRPGAALWYTP